MKTFKVGDLVKHTSRIKWRNQDARGMVVEITNSIAGPSYCKVLWVNEPREEYSTVYPQSLELVAKGSK